MEWVKLYKARCASVRLVILLAWLELVLQRSAGSVPPLLERSGRETSSGLPGLTAKPIFGTYIHLANFLINLPCDLEPPET